MFIGIFACTDRNGEWASSDGGRGWLLDGFPRNLEQAEALREAGVMPDVLLVLEVPDEELTARCVDRRLDPVSGKIYHLKTDPPPADEEVVSRLVQRGADQPEKVAEVLEKYRERTSNLPLLAISGPIM